MKLQKRWSGDQYSEQKKSPGRLHTWKNDWKAGGGAYRVTSVAAEFGINKSVVSRAWKAFLTTGTAVRKVGGGRPRTTTAGDDRYIILQAKRGRRQSKSVIAQQLFTATGRQVSRFNVARRLHKGSREHTHTHTQTGQLINGVVSSLRMRVGSVPEAILNAF
ncbi:transposable element Tcb2 transposase [Trichonephila clavipes]|nr:transposable element Tcb2 transposase [Trichonephila clavipes]